MAYIDYEYYKSLYGDKALEENDFNRLSWDACRKIDKATMGIDNVKKLSVAFPTDEEDVEMVKRCVCKVMHLLHSIEQAEIASESMRGFVQREDGNYQGKIVASASAGNESLSFTTTDKASNATIIDKALCDKKVQEQLIYDTVREYLSGVEDANGVNLLYMGKYPCKI